MTLWKFAIPILRIVSGFFAPVRNGGHLAHTEELVPHVSAYGLMAMSPKL